MLQWNATAGDAMRPATHDQAFFRCSVSILLLAADRDPGVEHDRVRIEHVLRLLLELESAAGLDTGVLDQSGGCGPELQVIRDIESAVGEQPLDLQTQRVSCNNTTHTYTCRRMCSTRRHIACVLHNDLMMGHKLVCTQ